MYVYVLYMRKSVLALFDMVTLIKKYNKLTSLLTITLISIIICMTDKREMQIICSMVTLIQQTLDSSALFDIFASCYSLH